MTGTVEPRSDPAAQAQVRTLALSLLGDVAGESLTQDRVREAVDTAMAALATMGRPVAADPDVVVREIEAQVNVFVGRAHSLDDPRDHQVWLPARRGEIDWRFWDRYRRYLTEASGYPPEPVRRLGEITDEILGRLENPRRPGPWDRRGMVVGQVQSGKTANYIGLICKAADAGYKLVVVLAGVHNSLRSQTQLRLDEGFLGFDTRAERLFDQRNRRVGVGRLTGSQRLLAVNSLTNSEERGDFNLKVARQVAMHIGSDPVLLVVKKNASILRNLIQWATELHQHEHPETGRMVVPDVPLLVIDDEADHASVNTKETPLDQDGNPDPDLDPTTINKRIRELLYRFEQSAYVAYTATPFANIFAFSGKPSEKHGDDVFPRSFIIRLPPPSDHIGPARVFGVEPDHLVGLEARPGLPIVREVTDPDDWLPPRHKKDCVPGELPASVREAIKAFVLTCAARAARGQTGVHNSMLIHVTRFVAVQELVADQVAGELDRMRNRLRYGDGRSPDRLLAELRALWLRDFVPTSAAMTEEGTVAVSWEDVRPGLQVAVSRIEVLRINGSAKDALAYEDHPEGASVIAVGGDKLSRGLTLEGLSVSYFLRASKMYDTLMQMGRWFGYRPGYLDLCRLYTTSELRDWYRDITAANEELLLLFDEMAAVGGTPENFGLRVRKHPDGLLITARAKMRNGHEMALSFEGSNVETIAFHTESDVQQRNLQLAERFLRAQTAAGRRRGGGAERATVVWEGVPGHQVADLLAGFVTHEDARKAQGNYIARYIRGCVAQRELTHWTVALASRASGGRADTLADEHVGLIQRSALESSAAGVYRIRRIASPRDEALDLDKASLEAALESTRANSRTPSASGRGRELVPTGPAIRRQRPKRRGLLVLYPLDPRETGEHLTLGEDFPVVMGFLVSFPTSETAPSVDYVVDNTYWQMEMGLS